MCVVVVELPPRRRRRCSRRRRRHRPAAGMCKDMIRDMWMHMCLGLCVDMCTEMCIEMGYIEMGYSRVHRRRTKTQKGRTRWAAVLCSNGRSYRRRYIIGPIRHRRRSFGVSTRPYPRNKHAVGNAEIEPIKGMAMPRLS